MCEYCKESEKAKIKRVVITFEYENPTAYGYPEVSFWKEAYESNTCPMCKRKLDIQLPNEKKEGKTI